MRCAICMLEGKRMSYQDVAVVGGYSLCENHLKEWALSGITSVMEWVLDYISNYRIEWERCELELEVKESASIREAEVEEFIHDNSEELSGTDSSNELSEEEISEAVNDSDNSSELSVTGEPEGSPLPEIEEKIMPSKRRGHYYCTSCDTYHRKKSKIGKDHREHEGEKND